MKGSVQEKKEQEIISSTYAAARPQSHPSYTESHAFYYKRSQLGIGGGGGGGAPNDEPFFTKHYYQNEHLKNGHIFFFTFKYTNVSTLKNN